MTNRTLPSRRARQPGSMLDGWAWIVVWPLVVIVAVAVLFTAPAQAQTGDEPPPDRLGGELYPPTDYPTVESDGVVEVGRYDIGCSNGGFIGDIACMTLGSATNVVFSIGKGVLNPLCEVSDRRP